MAYSLQSVIKGSLIYSGARVLTKASGFLLIPLYTRFLTPVDYGIMGYLDVLFRLLGTLLMFGFYGAQTRLFYDFNQDENKIGELLFTLNLFLIIALLLFCTTASLYGKPVYQRFGSASIPFYPYFPVKTWALFFQILNQMVIVYYMTIKDYKVCAALQFFQFLVVTAAVIVFVVGFNQGALGRFRGVLIGQGIAFLICYSSYIRRFKFKLSPAVLKFAFVFGLPIVVHLLTSVILESIDRVILEKYVTIDKLGIYTLGYQIGMVVSIVVASFNKAWTPNYYELMNENSSNKEEKVRQVFYAIIAFIGAICIIGSLYTNEYLPLLAPPIYYEARIIIPVILFSYFLQAYYFFGVQPVFYYKKTKILPLVTGSAAIVNIVLNYLLIPSYGIVGAAYATAASHIYLAVIVHFIGRRYFNPNYNFLKLAIISVYLFLVCCIIRFDEVNLKNEIYKVGLLIIYVMICYKSFGHHLKNITGRRLKSPLRFPKSI